MAIRRTNPAYAKPDMKPASAIIQLGKIARDCLLPGRRGKVLAVFSKAIYFLTEANELFWVAANDSPMHRRCAQTSSPLPGPLAGSLFRVEDHHLTIDPDFVFDIDNASLWSAPRLDSRHVSRITEFSARIRSFYASLDLSQVKGFGNFIPPVLSLVRNKSIETSSKYTDPILQFSQPFVLDMARAFLKNQPFRISRIADKLIGLGTGLTPSGDDFLGGLLFAINQLQAAYPNSDFTSYTIPIEGYVSWTHSISFTLLNDHANGHALAPLHIIINGLLGGESLESIHPFVSQLTQIGHSTGWDLLTGLLTGLLVTDPLLREGLVVG
jgi:hypothetical protein